jgi:hypothetical protein
MHPKIKFAIEKETHNTRIFNYLELTITNNHNKLTFVILVYMKPTNTVLVIHNDSCHPNKHKKTAITYLINRMITYAITHVNKISELNTINEILVNNHYRHRITTKYIINISVPETQRKEG